MGPGRDMGTDISASFTWMWRAYGANLKAFLVPGIIYGVLLLVTSGVPSGAQILWTIDHPNLPPDEQPAWISIAQVVGSLITGVGSLLWGTGPYRAGAVVVGGGRPSIGQAAVGTGALILASLLIAIGAAIGTVLCILPGLVLALFAMFALPAIASGQGVIEGIRSSLRLSWDHLGTAVVGFLIIVAGSMVGGAVLIGLIVVTPLSALFVTALHHRLNGQELPAIARAGA